MNMIDTTNTAQTVKDTGTPALTRKIGNKTFEVFVHFSETSTETMTDKIMRLIRNEVSFKDLS